MWIGRLQIKLKDPDLFVISFKKSEYIDAKYDNFDILQKLNDRLRTYTVKCNNMLRLQTLALNGEYFSISFHLQNTSDALDALYEM